MSADWKAGDLAVCIVDGWFLGCRHSPRKEEILRVNSTGQFGSIGIVLGFDGKPDDHRWAASGFRRIKPDTTPADDSAWLESLAFLRRKTLERQS